MSDSERLRLRWEWISACMALGLVMLGLAAFGESHKWSDVLTSTLVNIGSALLFSFVLFFFENRFTKRVVSTVQRVTDAAEERIAAQTAEFTTKLDDLESRLATRDATRRAGATSAVDALEEAVSADSVAQALEACREEGVISQSGITVPAYPGADDLVVTFGDIAKQYMSVNGPMTVDERLVVSVGVDQRAGQMGRPVIETEWEPTMDAIQLADALGAQLRRWDRHDEARKLDWPYIFRMLTRALQLANTITGPHATLGGKVYELATDDWLITSAGIEQVSTPRRISFRDALPPISETRPRPLFENNEPAAPDGIDPATWSLLRKRASYHTPRYY